MPQPSPTPKPLPPSATLGMRLYLAGVLTVLIGLHLALMFNVYDFVINIF